MVCYLIKMPKDLPELFFISLRFYFSLLHVLLYSMFERNQILILKKIIITIKKREYFLFEIVKETQQQNIFR